MSKTTLKSDDNSSKFEENLAILRKVIGLTVNLNFIERQFRIVSVLVTLVLFGSFETESVKNFGFTTIVIDAGHGGKDPGNLGRISKEKDVSLDVALKLGAILKERFPDVKVLYTRDNDSFPSLYGRADFANKNNADLFISIHCNSEPGDRAYGTETWVMGLHTSAKNLEVAKRENSVILLEENYEQQYEGYDPNSPDSHILFTLYQNAYLENSLKLAQGIEDQFKQRVKRRSRGVKQAGFVVLWKTAMPSVLVEIGFLSNRNEERYLNDDYGQTLIASGIFRAVRDYKKEIEANN